MFNTYKSYNNTYHPDKIEVVEKRAPTDESVRILKELEKEAMEKIIAIGKVEDNIFNAKWYIYGDNMLFEDRCKCIFTLNGKEYDFEFILPGKFTPHTNIIPEIKNRILKKLGDILVFDLFNKCDKILIHNYKR